MATKTTHKGISKKAVAAVGLGAAALAAAGAYWFYGSKDAKKHRMTARSWMLKARADMLEGIEAVMEKAGKIDKETYMRIASDVLARYSKVVGVTSAGMQEMKNDMLTTWKEMQKAGAKKTSRSSRRRSTSSKKKSR